MNLYGVGLGMIIFAIIGLGLLFIRYTEYVFKQQKKQREKRANIQRVIAETEQQMKKILADIDRMPEPHKTGMASGLVYMALDDKLRYLKGKLDN